MTTEYMPPKSTAAYSRLHMEAATCIWEEMLNARPPENASPDGHPVNDEWARAFDEAWESSGTVVMRHHAIDLSHDALSLWDAMTDEEQQWMVPYDWEFIPWFVRQTDWDGVGGAAPPTEQLLERVREEIVVRRGREKVLRG